MTSAATILSHEMTIPNLAKTSRFLLLTFRPPYECPEPMVFGILDLYTKKIYALDGIFFIVLEGIFVNPGDNFHFQKKMEALRKKMDFRFYTILPVSVSFITLPQPSSPFSPELLLKRLEACRNRAFVDVIGSFDIKVFLGFLLSGNLVSEPLPSLPSPSPSRPPAANHIVSAPRNNTVTFQELDQETSLKLIYILSP